jgi:parvulin-like peptidyl-prolyl isomerase
MSKRIVLYLSVLFLCTCAVCSQNTGSNKGVVIRVGNRSITGEDITRIVKFTSLENGIPKSVVWSSINGLVNKIVDDSLILEYGKGRGIRLDEIELERSIRDIMSDYPEERFKETLLTRCIDYSEWKQRLREQLLIRKIVRERTKSVGPITYDMIRSYYEQRHDEFSHPPRVKFLHIIATTRSDAEALISRVKDGKDMERIAQETLGHGVQVDGGMSWHSKDMLPPALSKAAFSLPVGKVSPIIQTPYGFHVIKVVQRELAGRKDLLEVMGEIEEVLLSKDRESHYARWLEELRQHYPVTVNYPLLDKIRTMNENQ